MTTPSQFLVTGGNGYLASWIVKFLLEAGHRVRTTVRSAPQAARYAHLHQLSTEHPGRLTLHTAELGARDRFQPLIEGCDFVLHTASPFFISAIKDPARELVRPAVEGTRSVLRAALDASSVHRIVMTSSAAAMYGDAADARTIDGRRAFLEADWNTSSSLNHQPYAYSKTLAERAAWEIAAQSKNWDLVTLNPGFMLGPAIAPHSSGVSHTVMRNFADGTYRSGIADLWYGLVDVRDVARAHLDVCFSPHAQGRYILSSEDGSLWTIAQRLRADFGENYPLPRRKAPKPVLWLLASKFGFTRKFVARNVGIPVHLDNRKSRRDLAISYAPIAQTIHEHFSQIIGARTTA